MKNHFIGGKNHSGVFPRIISMMPPHKIYIECFLGSGAILRRKKPAEKSIGIEIDPETIKNEWSNYSAENVEILNDDAFNHLYVWAYGGKKLAANPKDVLIYLDPPYLGSVRKSELDYYRYEMKEEADHLKLITLIRVLPYNVMISGYDCNFYNRFLPNWRKESFPGMSRQGQTTETIWMNFDEPAELHDYQFIGRDFTHRQQIKRKQQRWIDRIEQMQTQERYAFFSALESYKSSHS